MSDQAPGADLTGDGELTRDFLVGIGARIRALRTSRSLTVQQLADRAAISRRLLTQIELGQANPSLVAITRISRQLGTDFTELLDGVDAEAAIQSRTNDEHVLVWSSDAGSSAHLLQSTFGQRSADLWLWQLAPGDSYRGHADPDRSSELFWVVTGELTLTAGEEQVTLTAGSSARLRSDRPYGYANSGRETVTFVRVVSLSPL